MDLKVFLGYRYGNRRYLEYLTKEETLCHKNKGNHMEDLVYIIVIRERQY